MRPSSSRVEAIARSAAAWRRCKAHVPGERQPHAEGQWLHLLRGLDRLGIRIWWAETGAPEEYLDGLFDAFGEGRIAPPGRPPEALALPWANQRRPTGERQAHGITGAVAPEEPRTPEPDRRVVEVPAGDAEGARREERNTGTTRRAPSPSTPPRPSAARRAPSIPARQSAGIAARIASPLRVAPPPLRAPTPTPRAARPSRSSCRSRHSIE